MRTQFPLALSIGFLLLANGLITLRHVNAQQTGPRTGASPETPTQGQSAATRIARKLAAPALNCGVNTSYLPVVEGDFDAVMKKMSAAKPEVMKRQTALLSAVQHGKPAGPGRHDVAGESSTGRRTRETPAGATWEKLVGMAPTRSAPRSCSPLDSCRCRIRTIPKAGWSSRSSTSTRSRSRKGATSPASISISTCPTTSCPSFRRRCFSPRGRTSAMSRRASWSPSTTSTSCSTASSIRSSWRDCGCW